MKPIDSTAEILFLRMLGRSVDERWTAWAYGMLVAGFDTEDLVILAGEMSPFNQFEMKPLVDRVLKELNFEWTNRKEVLRNYLIYLINQVAVDKVRIDYALAVLSDAYLELDDSMFSDLYLLKNAKDDLIYSEDQWYWPGATRENIDEIVLAYFKDWIENNKPTIYN